MASFVNYVIWIRRQDIPKQASIEALVNEIDGDAADVPHVLHGDNHYWLAYIGLLELDKFHHTLSLGSRQ